MLGDHEQYLKTNYDHLCRFCLELSTVAKKNYEKLIQNDLHSGFINQFGLQLSKSDQLPKVVCQSCFKYLTKYMEFHKNCLNSYLILKNIHLEIKRETEAADVEAIWTADILPKHEGTLSDDNDYDGAMPGEEEYGEYKFENTGPNTMEENNTDDFAKPMVEIHVAKRKKEKKTEAEKKVKQISRKPCQCYICGKVVKRLSAHLVYHSQDRKHSCDICGRAFVFKGNLCQHINTHLMKDVKKFACDKCDKTFISNSSLRKHSKVHSGKDNFHCEICSRGFNRAATLRMHVLQVHQKNPTHPCHLCEKKYYSSTHLKDHIQQKHIDIPKPRVKCKDCEKSFKSEKYLDIHINAIHRNDQKKCVCTVCTRTFSRPSALKNHEKTHEKKKR